MLGACVFGGDKVTSHNINLLNTQSAREYAAAYLRAFKAVIDGSPVYNKPTAEAVKVAEDAG